MFGTLTIDKEIFFEEVIKLANKNYKETGEAILSTDQIYSVVDNLLDNKLSKTQEEAQNYHLPLKKY